MTRVRGASWRRSRMSRVQVRHALLERTSGFLSTRDVGHADSLTSVPWQSSHRRAERELTYIDPISRE
jgi:hypothetical protein